MRRLIATPSAAEIRRLFSLLEHDSASGIDLRQVVARMPQPLFIKDAASRLLMMNPACEAMWGVRFDDVAGTDGSGFCPPDQLNTYHANDRLAFARGETIIEEAPLWHATLQQQRWLITHKHPLYDADGRPHLLIGCSFDITARQQRDTALAEALAATQQAAGRQQDAAEHQHRRLALGMRDGLAQNLVALKLDIAALHARTASAQPLLHRRAGEALATLDASLAAVRDIINELYPPTLELGLSAAVEWQLQQLERQRGLRCTLRVVDDGTALDPQRAGALFHLIRQALDYAAGAARALDVELRLGGARQSVDITSDLPLAGAGAGIEALAAMRTRLATLGGKLRNDSHSLRFTLPGGA